MSPIDNKLSYLIVENNYLSTIFQPLKSKRIKYTCFDVSSNFLILGASSGGLYIFKRDPCVFLQLVPNKEGSVSNISISWDEKLIAFSTLKGITCVLELLEGSEARLINRSLEHSGSIVTSLVWAKSTNQLYVGDNFGRLSVINVSLFMNKNIFHVPAYMFMKLDSAVVQISCFEDYLLVSTRTRCYICDTTKEKYKQIGTQLREGLYGATFLNAPDGLKIYCARPGSRLWEADIQGNVRSTHQFKKALAVQSVAVVKLDENLLVQKLQSTWPDQSFNFCILVGLFDKYLFTFKSDGVYIFDPKTAEVILWSDHYKDIVDAKCINDIVYLWTSSNQIHSFVITPLNKCLVQLYFLGKYQLCVDVLEKFIDHAKSFPIMSKVTCLIGLKEHLPNINKNTKLSSYLENLILSVKDKQISSNLDSGIFLVDNKHWKKWKLNGKSTKTSRKKKIVRSYSLSDLSDISTKSFVTTRKEQNGALSLPEIEFNLGETNFNNVTTQNSLESTLAWNASLSGLFMQQIPFLSLTSPDLIQSTILELGQNVRRKLSMSTKSLQDKWNLFEGKIRSSKELYDNGFLDIEHKSMFDYSNYNNLTIEDDNMDKSIVYQPVNTDQKQFSLDVSNISNICEKISSGDKSDDSLFLLFDKIIEELVRFNQLSSSNGLKKSFPFKHFFNEKYIGLLKHIFSDSLSSHQVTKYLSRFKKYKFNCLDCQAHPYILKKMYTEEELNNDIALSNILLIFSEVLDPNTILEHIENAKLTCTFFSWSIVLDIFQDGAFSFFASKKESDLNYFECPLPFLLNMVFLMLRLEQIESGCHMAVKVNLKLYHISYLIIKLCLHLEFTGIKYQNCIDKCNKLLLNFILCLLNNRSLHFEELSHPGTQLHIEFAFLSLNKQPLSKCKCNYPMVGNSKIITKYPQIGDMLLNCYLIPFKYFNSENRRTDPMVEKLKSSVTFSDTVDQYKQKNDLFNENEFYVDFLYPNFQIHDKVNTSIEIIYSKIIGLLQTMPELISTLTKYFLPRFSLSCLPFIVQFGRIEEISYTDVKNNFALWKRVFDLFINLSNGDCCICHYKNEKNVEVDWNKVSLMALKYLGSSQTLKLLLSCADSIPSEAIDISFLRLFFLRPLIQEENETNLSLIDVFHEKLNPIKRGILQQESSLTELLETEQEYENEYSSNIHTIEIDLKSDICCHCSLILKPDNVEERIRLFRCKHVYHLSCLRRANSLFGCPLCFKKMKK